MSTRGSVGTGDNVLISGFIVGDVDSATVVVRALGPSLASYGVSGVLSDPTLTIYDSTGAVIASNDNWQDNVNCDRCPEEWTRAAESVGIGTRASPACRSIYRHRERSQRRYRQCLSRSLPPRLVPFLSDSKVAATTQADTRASDPVHNLVPESINTPRSNFEKFCA